MSNTHTLRILTIDDSRTILGILHHILSDADYDVIQASDGREGLNILKAMKPSPDVIFTDLNMPNLDGFGFIREARGLKEFTHTPIICLTTECDETKKQQARKIGATGWITKPFKAEKLLWTIKRVTA